MISHWTRMYLIVLGMLICHTSVGQQTASTQAPSKTPQRLPRTELLQYRDGEGNIKTAQTPSQWSARRDEIIAGMHEVMGPFPESAKRVPLKVEVQSEEDCGTYVRRLITYQSQPESRVPAYLCIPKVLLSGDSKAAAILCLHPTDDRVGHKVVVGLGGPTESAIRERVGRTWLRDAGTKLPTVSQLPARLEALGWSSGTLKAVGTTCVASICCKNSPLCRMRPSGRSGIRWEDTTRSTARV
ncbi:MAG: hypothetical protein R3C05_27660 [Pirellulaceae bacterium]